MYGWSLCGFKDDNEKTFRFRTFDNLKVSRRCSQTHPGIPHNSHWSIPYEIQAAHWWWSLNVQPLSLWRGPYQNPTVTERSLRVLPNSLNSLYGRRSSRISHSQVILKSLPCLNGLTKVHLNTQCQHTSNRGLTTTPPLPVPSVDITVPSMKGPYQTPTRTTRTYRLRGKKQAKGVTGLPSLQEFLTSQL